ncbi:MAG TPA: T9SS type A sorting domain-containing protein [Bacteroidales bacterium]|nr:T9SS type A sorting domain-containing protein [Bacteroidales bacterium]
MAQTKTGDKTLDVTPNPFSSYTIVTFPEDILRPCSIELFDLNGDKIYSYSNIISNKFILSGKQLKKGSYYYKVFNLDYSFFTTGKIIIN